MKQNEEIDMNWLEITIHTASDGIDRVATALTAAGFTDLVMADQAEFESFLEDQCAGLHPPYGR